MSLIQSKELENKLNQGESFGDIVRSRIRGLLSILFENILNLHNFQLDELDLLKKPSYKETNNSDSKR